MIMSEKLSRVLLWVEFVPLILVTALTGIVSALVLPDIRSAETGTLLGLTAVALGAVAVWRIAIGFLQGGAAKLHALSFFWWSGALLGVLVGLLALLSLLSPDAERFSALGDGFCVLVFGLLLVLPFLHLGCEAWLRGVPGPVTSSESPATPPDVSATPTPSATAGDSQVK
jgi:hypothetical protein